MHDSINTGRIVDAVDRLTHEVRGFRHEMQHRETARLYQKLGFWSALVLPSIVFGSAVLIIVIVLIPGPTKKPVPSIEKPRPTGQVELPDKNARER